MSRGDPPGVDLERLRTFLDDTRPGIVGGPLEAKLVPGGRSNLTYLIDDDTRRWVLRRPPLGHVQPTAHDMAREYRVITALRPTPVPVPETLVLCQDTEVLGAPFYLMEYVPGIPYRTKDEFAALGPERVGAIGDALVDTLADLHAVDPAAVGLADFGRPEGFLERQVRRWGKQLKGSRSRELPGIDELHAGLGAHLPASPAPAVVHGDFRLDNVLIGEDDRINAVLDWEMSTLGDPLTDLALLLVYAEATSPEFAFVSDAAAAPGYPGSEHVIARYVERSGRDVSTLDWYRAFAFFKLAVVLEGIYFRFSKGQTVGEGFEQIGAGVQPLVDLGNETLARMTSKGTV